MINNLMIPFMIFVVVIYGLKQKINVYDTFIEGTKESFDMIISMFPYLLGMILSINIFTGSNFLDALLSIFKPIFSMFNIPDKIVPLGIMRSISGNSSLALLNNIYLTKGVDSYISILASVIIGSTETTFYVISLYFSIIGIKKIRYALKVSLIADLISFIISIIVVKILFG